MTNHHYRDGRALEHLVRRKLESKAYELFRSAGSKGAADLLAFGWGEILFVQVKRSGVCPPAERRKLLALASRMGTQGLAIVASKPVPRQPVEFRLLTGEGPRDWIPYELVDARGAE